MHEINVVPYVDVMLVLLVIFMVTAPLVTPGVIDRRRCRRPRTRRWRRSR
jgi:biopolymer transport protein TolR